MLPEHETTCLLEFDETTRDRLLRMAGALKLEPARMVAVVILLGLEKLESEMPWEKEEEAEIPRQNGEDVSQQISLELEKKNRLKKWQERAKRRPTEKQEKILRWLGEGWGVGQIAEELGVKEVTVRTHLYRLRKMFEGVGLEELKRLEWGDKGWRAKQD